MEYHKAFCVAFNSLSLSAWSKVPLEVRLKWLEPSTDFDFLASCHNNGLATKLSRGFSQKSRLPACYINAT